MPQAMFEFQCFLQQNANIWHLAEESIEIEIKHHDKNVTNFKFCEMHAKLCQITHQNYIESREFENLKKSYWDLNKSTMISTINLQVRELKSEFHVYS